MANDPDPIGAARDEVAAEGIAKSKLPTPGEQPGDLIGRYKLLEQIGEGGMGTIWMAEQREPVRRRVALKIIKLGMDTKNVIARFEAERQALALMDHPHIAKVLDAGATDAGRPYFVMDYIKGIPILEYCDRERLDTSARLELFTSVCHAIQHAHQKGIVHRDIKPSNVLVTLHDGVPVPKVIDFGIAKATNGELTTKTLFTEHRQMIGTPAYMSPEQAEMSGLDIDTRSDIYSLGVLLYELLTGTTPFNAKALLESGFDEMLRAIREDEPHKPSTRISKLGDTGTRTAQQRRVELRRLGVLLRGDLDWVVMKCLEKDRTRRYETANGLAADVLRHLHDEPVTAGPPSATYKLRKFVRRHRVPVIAASVVLTALVAGVVGTSWGMVAQGRARAARLQQQLDDEKRTSLEHARLGRNAEAVASLLARCEEALRAGDASEAAIALDAARKRAAEGGADGEAERLARLAADLGLLEELDAIDQFKWTWTDRGFANPDDAAARDHAALRRYGAEPESADAAAVDAAVARVGASTVRARIVLVLDWLFFREKKSKELAGALRAVLDSVDADPFRSGFRSAVHSDDKARLLALTNDPALLEQPAEFAAALGQSKVIPVARRRELLERAALRRPADLALSMALQGSYEFREPKTLDERIRWLQAALAANPQYFPAYVNLGNALLDAGQLEESIACHRKTLEIVPDRMKAQVWTNFGVVFETQGKLDEAIACDQKALEFDPGYADAHINLGLLLGKQGKDDEAIARWRKALELVPDHAKVHCNVAEALWKVGRLDEALVSYREVVELDPKWGVAWKRLAELLQLLGRNEEAIEPFRKSIEVEPTAFALASLGALLRRKGQVDEAIALFRQAIALDPAYDAYGGLAVSLKLKGQLDEAIPLMRKSLELRPDYAGGMRILGESLYARGEIDEALAWIEKAVALDPKDLEALMDLGAMLDRKGRFDEAIACQRRAIELAPGDFRFHHNLGSTLAHAGRNAEAAASFRRSIELDPTRSPAKASAYYSVGNSLKDAKRFDEAIAAYRDAIECDPGMAEAHCNLGQCYLLTARYAEAAASYRRGHELGSQLPNWRYPSAEWVRGAEAKAALEAKLPALVSGEVEPADVAERLECAEMCWRKGLLHAEVLLLTAAFAADPRLADDLAAGHRYDAACSAARASAGQGDDTAPLDEADRAELLLQAIAWLRADLALHAKRWGTGKPEDRAATTAALRKWLADAELACIREPEALDLLPDEERAALEELWLDVKEMTGGDSR